MFNGVIPFSRVLGGGVVQEVAETINLDGATQYLQLQGASTRLDVSTETLAVSAWVYHDGVDHTWILQKGRHTVNGDAGFLIVARSSGKLEISYRTHTTVSRIQYNESAPVLSIGWNHVVIYDDRSSTERDIVYIVDGIDVSGGTWFDQNGLDSSIADMSNTYNLELGAAFSEAGSRSPGKAAVFVGVAIGTEITLSDAIALYNGGSAPCWDLIPTTQQNKFDAFFPNTIVSGSTELEALTDKVNGWVLDNINSAPFVDNGLTVEC